MRTLRWVEEKIFPPLHQLAVPCLATCSPGSRDCCLLLPCQARRRPVLVHVGAWTCTPSYVSFIMLFSNCPLVSCHKPGPYMDAFFRSPLGPLNSRSQFSHLKARWLDGVQRASGPRSQARPECSHYCLRSRSTLLSSRKTLPNTPAARTTYLKPILSFLDPYKCLKLLEVFHYNHLFL